MLSSLYCASFSASCPPRDLHSFPTRRSSDLDAEVVEAPVLLAPPPAPPVSGEIGKGRPTRPHDHRCQPAVGEPTERVARSEEHTSELQSQSNLVCRLLLEKKNHTTRSIPSLV